MTSDYTEFPTHTFSYLLFSVSCIELCFLFLSTPPVLLRLYFRNILCFNKSISLEARATLVKIR